MSITRDSFASDPHGRLYLGAFDQHPDASAVLCRIVSTDAAMHRMVMASELGKPALLGVIADLEADPAVAPVVEAELRFRQMVGVAVRLRMAQLGWATTGRKGSITSNSSYFGQAEVYVAPATA